MLADDSWSRVGTEGTTSIDDPRDKGEGTPTIDSWSQGETEGSVTGIAPLTHSTTLQINRVWGNWGEYTLDPKWRRWALEELGVGETPITIDLFAEPWSAAAEMYITKDMDSMSYSWGTLQREAGGLLWANPPFRMMPQVASKISNEGCLIALCTPEWEQEEWWSTLKGLPHWVQRLPPRSKLFFGGFRKTALPQKKEWRTVVWIIDSRDATRKEGSTGKGLAELKKALEQMGEVHWTHGLRGGKPMFSNQARKPMQESATQTNPEEEQRPDQPLIPEGFFKESSTATSIHNNAKSPEGASHAHTMVRTLACTARATPEVPHAHDQISQTPNGVPQQEADIHSEVSSQQCPSTKVDHQTHSGNPTSTGRTIPRTVYISMYAQHKRPPTGELEPHLRVEAVLNVEGVVECQARVLLDTGAEVSLVRRGLIPESAFREAACPVRLIAANNLQVEGGEREVELEIRFQGVDFQTRHNRILHLPSVLLEADIEEDVILSYRWMGERDVRVGPRPHGFWIHSHAGQWWVAGIRTCPQQRTNARLPRARCTSTRKELKNPDPRHWISFAVAKAPPRSWRIGGMRSSH